MKKYMALLMALVTAFTLVACGRKNNEGNNTTDPSMNLPDSALTQINNVPNGTIPDVPMTHNQASAIYKLYRAGILQGRDSGYFYATSNINRAEAAAMLSRMAESDNRLEFEL